MKLKQAFEPQSPAQGQTDRGTLPLLEWTARRPVLAIVLVSLVATVMSCYPVIFCGKSYVSPARGLPVVYDSGPPLPGMKAEATVNDHGSDSAAAMIWAVPVGFVESRSVLEYGELPLWNRYSHAGDTLIGQAIVMLGDPLQLIVIFGRGSALAWDIKFLIAKFLFCVGFGLLIRRLLNSIPLALIFAGLGAYCGAFFFIDNHFTFFVFCYAPWILLSAMEFLDLKSKRHVCWGLIWLLVNFACFNAGLVEPAVILIGALNLAALTFALVQHHNLPGAVRVLARMAVGALLFLGLTAPVCMAFFATLPGSFSLHSDVHVTQLPVVVLLGIFDDIFFRLPLKSDAYVAVASGSSLLVAVGTILSFLKWRQLRHDPFFWINTCAIALWGGCVFGWVPGWLLSAVPLLNRIGHTCAEFSLLLVVHLTIQCAYGFSSLSKDQNFGRVLVDFVWAGVILSVALLLFNFGIQHRPVPWNYFICAASGAFGAPLLFAFLKSRAAGIPLYAWAAILILGFLPQFRFGLYSFGDNSLLMLPGPRVALNAPSQAIEEIRKDTSGPFRVVGVRRIMYGDYAAVYGLEDIRSCAPLANGDFMELVRGFPGIAAHQDWVFEVADPVAAHALLNLFNVKYLLTPPDVTLQQGLGYRLAGRSDFGILENQEAWPRAFFTDKVTSVDSTEEFIRYLLENGREPFVAMTSEELQNHPYLLQLASTAKPAVIAATRYTLLPNSTSFDVHASSAGVVCLTEGQARDFEATANGRGQEVFTLNRAFKGIYLDEPGNYHITFTYQPHHWGLACTLFLAAAGFVVVFVLLSFFRHKNKDIVAPPNPSPKVA